MEDPSSRFLGTSTSNSKRPASRSSSDEFTSSISSAYKRRGRDIRTIRRGTSLSQAIARLDPWHWDVEDVIFALTDSRSLDIMGDSNLLPSSLRSSLGPIFYGSLFSSSRLPSCKAIAEVSLTILFRSRI